MTPINQIPYLMLLNYDCTLKTTTNTSSIILQKSVCCCLHKGLKDKSLDSTLKTVLTLLALFCPQNSPLLFSLLFPIWSMLQQTVMRRRAEPFHRRTPRLRIYKHSPLSIAPHLLILPHHCPSIFTVPLIIQPSLFGFDGRGTHFSSRKLPHPFLEVICSRMIGVD